MSKTTTHTIESIKQILSDATGEWTGCNWETGDDYIESLEDVSAAAAREKRDAADEDDRREWDRAIDFLETCESDAAGAEEAGGEAVAALEAGDNGKAMELAERACSIERHYGDCPTWRKLRDAIKAYAEAEEDKADRPTYRCGCGTATGERCEWTGSAEDMVVVEYMPECHRASHEAAGNAGVHPHNGAVRFAAERSCADSLVEGEGGWASVIEGADPAEYADAV